MAGRYAGEEISSTQALIDAGIPVPDGAPTETGAPARSIDSAVTAAACAQVRATLEKQVAEWKQRSFFERQWLVRDFKQRVGVPPERCLESLAALEVDPAGRGRQEQVMCVRLARFYAHMGELAAGYVKDPTQREEQLAIVAGWKAEVDGLIASIPGTQR
jgi:acyl-CoA reductase-like NAD-dependent aldehyde dehydrogenase